MKRYIAFILCLCLLTFPVHGEAEEKLVALTFDDGPSGKYTAKLLEGLAQRDAKATFLLCGYRIDLYPQLTKRIHEEGHEIGLHGYSHKSMEHMCSRDISAELKRVMDLLPDDCSANFIRSPGGLDGKCVKIAAEKLGLSILSWSVDPKDWATHDTNAIKKEVVEHIQDGDVILLHDMSHSSVDAALLIIDQLQAQGFRFVTASELAQAKGFQLQPGKKYTCFRNP